MDSDLFRKEVLDARYARLPGRLIVKTPRFVSFLIYFFLISLIAAATLLLLSEFSKKEVAVGRLVPTQGLIKVIPGLNGFVEEVLVTQGDRVKTGQLLAKIASGTGQFAIENQIKSQRKTIDEIDQQIAQETETSAINSSKLVAKAEGLRSQITAMQTEKELRLKTIEALRVSSEAGKKLAAKQILNQRESEKRSSDLREAQLNLSLLARETLILENEVQQVEADLLALPKELKLTLSRLNFQKLGIVEQIDILNSQLHYEVTSPHDGIVDFVAEQEGQSITQSSLLLSIIPSEAKLEAEIYLPVKSITSLKVGQPIRIDYDAFPAARYGHALGTVTKVNQTVLDPAEAKIYGVNTDIPVYRIAATLEKQEFVVDGQGITLRAGVGFTADVIVEKHPLWVWATRYITEGWNAK